MEISAKIIAHSIMKGGHELITYELEYPFIIHGEMMTHRMFSRNAASARAIPYHKLRESVAINPFVPLNYQREHKGMQGKHYIDKMFKDIMDLKWLSARDTALRASDEFVEELAVTFNGNDYYTLEETIPTKQLANRILQPYSMMRVIVTTGLTEGLTNFFTLRQHEDAEIHIQELANRMYEAWSKSSPIHLNEGEWHIPYQYELIKEFRKLKESPQISDVIAAATGKVARISYTTFPDEKPLDSYLRIHDHMLNAKPFHASAFEHVHRNMTQEEYMDHSLSFYKKVDGNVKKYTELGWSRNTRGSLSYRTLIENGLIEL